MSEMTPERLREVPGTRTVPSSVLDAFASAWEADLARIEELERAAKWAGGFFWRIGEKAAHAKMDAALKEKP